MQDNDRPLYSRKHVELLVKLAFIKGQEEEEATIHYIDEKIASLSVQFVLT